ncbi:MULTISPECIES: hypothetical protein [Nocardiopsis]|uniref:Uncharacterized protein n=1 Tax=Nocardiopsis sinuspersici TaxID=501010 RepID=A0A1V3C3U5_9ACTN|nr:MULTISPECIES: hypothetical protein [Nocardiopsis]NYH51768.1 hypothetical protein [Nocardiopsis sinuspersici]OOC55363.1 hypothetical protein NOSIN_17350 [Nocardiopsis sinuspersici]
MTSITETIGFIAGSAMPSRRLSLTAVPGIALGGRVRALASSGECTATGTGVGNGTTGGFGGLGFRLPLLGSRLERTGHGSGVPAESELALGWGEPMSKHAEATQRRYGVPGECPRRIPA